MRTAKQSAYFIYLPVGRGVITTEVLFVCISLVLLATVVDEATNLLGWSLLELTLIINDLSNLREAVDLSVNILQDLTFDLLHLEVELLLAHRHLMLELVVGLPQC